MLALHCGTSDEQREGQASQQAAGQMAQMHDSCSLPKNTMHMNYKEMQLMGRETQRESLDWREKNVLQWIRQDQFHKKVRDQEGCPWREVAALGHDVSVPGMFEGHQDGSPPVWSRSCKVWATKKENS